MCRDDDRMRGATTKSEGVGLGMHEGRTSWEVVVDGGRKRTDVRRGNGRWMVTVRWQIMDGRCWAGLAGLGLTGVAFCVRWTWTWTWGQPGWEWLLGRGLAALVTGT